MMSLMAERLGEIRQRVARAAEAAGRDPKEIQLMAVTKTVEASVVNAAIDCGAVLIGENKVQELCKKLPNISGHPEVHFIGSLQTNKVKQLVPLVSMIQSVNSFKLAREIDKQAAALGRCMDILLEVNIAKEASKSGVLPEDVWGLMGELAPLEHLRLRGLMAIVPKAEEGEPDRYFSEMQKLFIDIGSKKLDNSSMNVLSMGMSGDFETAIAYGSTLVRIGSALFGAREGS